jgi:uncharacterized protein CbrC (UPF0167 family)
MGQVSGRASARLLHGLAGAAPTISSYSWVRDTWPTCYGCRASRIGRLAGKGLADRLDAHNGLAERRTPFSFCQMRANMIFWKWTKREKL